MSRRHEHRRAERKAQKVDLPLTATEIARLNSQRTLPADHPSVDKAYFVPTPLDLCWHAIDVIDRSGVVPYLERRLRDHPGKKSTLPVQALLVVMVIAAFMQSSFRRTDLCAVIHGLEPEAAFELGLCSRVARTMFGYGQVVKQCLRLERALLEAWIDDDGTVCDHDWFAHCLLKANITAEQAEQITAIAIDSTFLLAWANPHSYPHGKKPPGGQRSADPSAKFGHRSATAKRKAGTRLGFDLHIPSGARGRKKWRGDPKDANLEADNVPPLPLHMKVVPANTDVAPIALECIDWAKKVAPNAKEVLADGIYTTKNERFNRRLHQAGMQTVMKLDKRERKRVRQHMFGTNRHCLIENCGTFFPCWLHEDLHKPPAGLTGEKLKEWFDLRAIFRYSIDSIDQRTGNIRFSCPQCAGRIRTNLKTRNPKANPSDNTPHFTRTDKSEYCCPGRVTVPVKYLDRFNPIPFGTTAWEDSYNRRNQIENLNGILRDKGGLGDKWCRALGVGARFVGAVMIGVAYLLGETKLAYLASNGDNDDLDPSDDNAKPEPGDVESTPNSKGHNPNDRPRDGPH